MEATSDAAKDLATADQPPAKATNRLCMMGLNAGVLVLAVNILVITVPCLLGNLPVFGIFGGPGGLYRLQLVSGLQISLAGAVIGICVVGLIRVLRSKGAERGIGEAFGGILAALAVVIVACLQLVVATFAPV